MQRNCEALGHWILRVTPGSFSTWATLLAPPHHEFTSLQAVLRMPYGFRPVPFNTESLPPTPPPSPRTRTAGEFACAVRPMTASIYPSSPTFARAPPVVGRRRSRRGSRAGRFGNPEFMAVMKLALRLSTERGTGPSLSTSCDHLIYRSVRQPRAGSFIERNRFCTGDFASRRKWVARKKLHLTQIRLLFAVVEVRSLRDCNGVSRERRERFRRSVRITRRESLYSWILSYDRVGHSYES